MQNVALLSSSYSGSTLLSLLMCSHPNVCGFGDTYNFQFVKLEETRCSCGSVPSIKCPMRIKVSELMKKSGCYFDWATSNPTPLFKLFRSNKNMVSLSRRNFFLYIYRGLPLYFKTEIFSNYYKENIAFLNAIENSGNFSCYFDGSKNIVRLELLKDVFPNTKVIHLARDPKGYLHSCLKRKIKNYKKIINEWIRYNNNAHQYKKILGRDNYLFLRYEDIAENPNKTLSKIQKYIGLSEIDLQGNYENNIKNTHVIGNKMKNRFKKVDKKKISWENKLDKKHISYLSLKIKRESWIKKYFE